MGYQEVKGDARDAGFLGAAGGLDGLRNNKTRCKYRQRTQKDLHVLARQSPVNCVLHGDCKPHAHIPNTLGASMLPSVSDMSISATV